ncbi:Transcriptional regulator containing PAS, AAA-type ATPase, and DNA-binding Fis domains [Gracilibacillus orientalis]|uniref:Transcriptional regulator containing PAS, AAA-type ATPase, and DNA-binding Fis domains n=1 Tax=Gracilibacillus orientalis TaxID=334253 RepID=A0A1I4R3J5_9BACI|nr:sigma-54-dependent Fis family transcriptional regulator [Gracilibacillus orientalis]SFM46821.1 Transcriptional regulator containing PAS, AAA-type ATPase, and DNA-binding Fis domains [Gracilibacillus orientalis]
MIKALLIAPYSGLAEIAKKAAYPDDIQLDIVIGNLDEGVKIAQQAEKQGYQLIISRGGTATMIQDAISIPVVHIDITGYDMLRVFTLLRGLDSGVALVGYSNISEGANTICNILEFDVKMITIEDRKEVRGHLQQLKQDNYSVVIGDVITVQVAEEVGLRGVLITSGKEALMDAMEEGKRVHHFFRKVNRHFNYFRYTFTNTPLPIVLLDQQQNIIEKNLKFDHEINDQQILKSPKITLLIQRVLAGKGTHWAELIEGDNRYDIQAFVVNEREGIIGLILHVSLIETEIQSISIYDSVGHEPILGESSFAHSLKENLGHYVYTDEPVGLIGEPGTGKFTLAREIHFQRFGQDAPLMLIDAGKLKDTEMTIISRKISRLDKGTLVIKDIDKLARATSETIEQVISSVPHLKVIVLTNPSLVQLVAESDFSEDLYQKITKYPLHIPPLRMRKVDIRAYVDFFITEFHTHEGMETLGMKREAVEQMQQYTWKGNLSQLKQVVRELSMMSSGNYIEKSQVEQLLTQYEAEDSRVSENHALPLEGTLKEIEQQVITIVLEEENQNQSKAASRLGINRSTLWRKLKLK